VSRCRHPYVGVRRVQQLAQFVVGDLGVRAEGLHRGDRIRLVGGNSEQPPCARASTDAQDRVDDLAAQRVVGFGDL
jgi:hypothetical protein